MALLRFPGSKVSKIIVRRCHRSPKNMDRRGRSADASRPLLTRRRLERTQKARCCRSKFSIRRPKGKGAFLVLTWNLLISSYQYTALGSLVDSIYKIVASTDDLSDRVDPWVLTVLSIILQTSLFKLLYPFAGWLADAKLGRYKVMRVSVWIMWAGSVILTVTLIVQFALSLNQAHSYDSTRALYASKWLLVVIVIAYILNAIGVAGFQANVIPFGIDQMEDGSGDEYSAFIHWYYWTRNLSLGIVLQLFLSIYHCGSNDLASETRNQLYVLITEVAFLSLALCIDFFFSHVLIKEPKTQNPLKMVVKVSSFILRHKGPVGRRSALTFNSWQATIPTRSSFAKKIYGGPFESEDVEDVKTFWSILLLLFSLGGFFMAKYAAGSTYGMFTKHAHSQLLNHACHIHKLVTSAANPLVIIVSIPLYELAIFPLFHKYVLPMLKRIGVGMTVALLGILSISTMDIIGHAQNYSAGCMFYGNASEQISLDSRWLVLPVCLEAFGEMLVVIPIFEFICAQSPYSMRGLLIGLYYCIDGVSSAIAGLMLLGFAEGFYCHRSLHSFSCGSSYYVTATLIAVVGFIVYLATALWYRKRKRGDQEFVNERAILESYYENVVQSM